MKVPAIGDLTLREKIGQLFVHAVHGRYVSDSSPEWIEIVRHVEQNRIGGIIWMPSTVLPAAWMIARLQQRASIPLLMSADLEAGAGMRFQEITWWPPAMAIAATGNPDNARTLGRITAREAKAIGIHQIFAPVADVNVNPRNPVINTRSFGEDPHAVARYVVAFIEGVQSEGLLATAKHFPGHGDTAVDSHRSLPTLDVSRARLDAIELVPFRAAIAAGVASVMVGHLAVPQLDAEPIPVRRRSEAAHDNPYGTKEGEVPHHAVMPATLSRRIVTSLLREELRFDGLVVTDAMDMGGVVEHFDAGEAAVRAIDAGCDQLVMTANVDMAIEAIESAIGSGRLSVKQIDGAVTRILAAKKRLPDPVAFDPDAIGRTVDSADHQRTASRIAAESITVIRRRERMPVARGSRVALVIVSDVIEATPALRELQREIEARTACTTFRLTTTSSDEEIARAMLAARDAETVIAAFLVRARSGLGRISIPTAPRAAIAALAAQRSVIGVACGSPYLPLELPELSAWICAWGPQHVLQRAAAQALFGEIEAGGRMPVSVG